ncbi:MAG TPA: hypothetical protein PKD68_00015 [Candidatus Saccharibacteria bacterium]|nr:hypothetical protein [Candidatus Saccharibacteria bacterium]
MARQQEPKPLKGVRRPPATTPEQRESRMIALAFDRVEQRIKDGTASAQELVHYLKLGSMTTELEREKLRYDTELRKAQVEAIESQQRSEELFREALSAFRVYTGEQVSLEDDDDI